MTGRDAILAVFLRVLNEMQGYSGDYPHIAHLERYLERKGKLGKFQNAFSKATGSGSQGWDHRPTPVSWRTIYPRCLSVGYDGRHKG